MICDSCGMGYHESYFWDDRCGHCAAKDLSVEVGQKDKIIKLLGELELDHETDCAVIALAYQATHRWWPECDCRIDELQELLSVADTRSENAD